MPTALELTREGWKSYVEAARRRPGPPELAPADQHERERLLIRFREAAAAVKTRFKARRVVRVSVTKSVSCSPCQAARGRTSDFGSLAGKVYDKLPICRTAPET